MSNLLQDLRYAFRSLFQNPIFALVALLSLSLGIGCNTAIFGLMDQVLVRMLPVLHPEELVLLTNPPPGEGLIFSNYSGDFSFSYPMYRDIRDHNPVFSGVLARMPVDLNLSWRGETERVHGELVSGNYFEVLGVPTVLGRAFSQADDRIPGAHPVVMLSHGYWVRRFAASRAVLNQTVTVNGRPMTIIGVTAPNFQGVSVGDGREIFVPLMMKAQMTPGWDDLENRRSIWLNVIARLKPGISPKHAEAAMNTFWRPILENELSQIRVRSKTFRARFLNKHMALLPGSKGLSSLRDSFSTPLILLMGMVGLVLLIACANVANLLIARAAARQREIAIRFALGASRARMIRQLLTENLLLAAGGGALGILIASWTGSGLLHFLPQDSGAQSLSADPDLRVLSFTALLSLTTGLIFGLIPAFQATRSEFSTTLKEQGGSVSLGTGQVRFRKILVVCQIVLSLLLLIGAGLFTRSLLNLRRLDTGFRADHLMTFTINPALNGYDPVRVVSFFQRLQEGLSSLPGVRGASMSSIGLLSGDDASSNISVEGYHEKEDEDMSPHRTEVGPGYFATLGIPLIAGRDITEADIRSPQKVAVINQRMAQYFFGNTSPLGRHFGFGSKEKPDIEIVGVVKDGKYARLREQTPRFLFVPYSQARTPLGRMTCFVRTAQDPSSVATALRREVQKLDPNLPLSDMKTMEAQIDESVMLDRVVAILSAFFGILATLLAAVGLYGVMAYTVARRTREIGIRIALGADREQVLRLVMLEVGVLAVIGIAIAVPVSLPLGTLVQSQLFGLNGRDPVVIVAATLLLSLTALLSGYLPALRATRVDPIVALRYE